jgi:dihydromonapterin reductase/dihydrofolate reductase
MRALVTGCGRRLGFYLCEQLVAAGWQVTGSYRSERPELARLRGVGVELVQADFTREEEVGAVVTALAAHEDLALIIHNASAFEPRRRILRCSWPSSISSTGYTWRLPSSSTGRWPRPGPPANGIIHITDIYIHAPAPQFAAYVATKAGAHSLAMSFARELAPAVRVNTIEPGPILFLDEHGDDWRQQVLAKTPLAREGGLEPIWQAVQMLMKNDYDRGQHPGGRGRALAVI